MTTYKEDNLLVVIFVTDFLNSLLVARSPEEIFPDDAVGYHLRLVTVFVDGTRRVDVVRAGGQNEISLFEYHLFKHLDHFVKNPLTQNIGVPKQYELGIFGLQLGGDGIEEGVRAVEQNDVRLFLVDDFL